MQRKTLRLIADFAQGINTTNLSSDEIPRELQREKPHLGQRYPAILRAEL